jgi:hypothetical protein
MLSKILIRSGLSRLLWIKDRKGHSHYPVSSNLLRLLYWVGPRLQTVSSRSRSPSSLAAVFCATHPDYRTSLALSTPCRFTAVKRIFAAFTLFSPSKPARAWEKPCAASSRSRLRFRSVRNKHKTQTSHSRSPHGGSRAFRPFSLSQ